MQQAWSTDWKRRWSARAILGTVARSDGYCPVDIKDWRKVKKDNASHSSLQDCFFKRNSKGNPHCRFSRFHKIFLYEYKYLMRQIVILSHFRNLIVDKVLVSSTCENWILKSIGRDWRKYKATLKKKLFKPNKKKNPICTSSVHMMLIKINGII